MTKKERVRFNMFARVVQFLSDNSGDFAAGGVVRVQLAVLSAVIAAIETLTGKQTGGMNEARFSFKSKDTARENLREMLLDIVETARSMVYSYPGIELKFQLPGNLSDVNMLAAARAFLPEATAMKSAFVAYEMENTFTTDLQTLIDEFEASLNAPGTATDTHIAATAEIGAEIRKGMVAVRMMDAAVRNKYRANPGKLAAWASASHIEREPQTPPVAPVA